MKVLAASRSCWSANCADPGASALFLLPMDSWAHEKTAPRGGSFFPEPHRAVRHQELLRGSSVDSGRSGVNNGSSSSRSSVGGSRSSGVSGGRSGLDDRSGSRSSSVNGRSGRGFFLLAAGGQGSGSDQGGHQERLVHAFYLSQRDRKLPVISARRTCGKPAAVFTRHLGNRKLEHFCNQPSIIQHQTSCFADAGPAGTHAGGTIMLQHSTVIVTPGAKKPLTATRPVSITPRTPRSGSARPPSPSHSSGWIQPSSHHCSSSARSSGLAAATAAASSWRASASRRSTSASSSAACQESPFMKTCASS